MLLKKTSHYPLFTFKTTNNYLTMFVTWDEKHRSNLYLIKMNLFKKNQSKSDRTLRFIVSLFLLPTQLFLELSLYTLIICAIGGVLMFNALSGVYMIYKVLGVDTCKT